MKAINPASCARTGYVLALSKGRMPAPNTTAIIIRALLLLPYQDLVLQPLQAVHMPRMARGQHPATVNERPVNGRRVDDRSHEPLKFSSLAALAHFPLRIISSPVNLGIASFVLHFDAFARKTFFMPTVSPKEKDGIMCA